MIHRRALITGLAAALAAPAIIRTPGLLMPIKPLAVNAEYLGHNLIAIRWSTGVWHVQLCNQQKIRQPRGYFSNQPYPAHQ